MSAFSTLLDIVLPPTCAACNAPVATLHTLCPTCFAGLQTINDPACHSCGLPFASEAAAGPARLCARCTDDPPPWRRARAAMLYDDGSRALVLAMKHADRQENARVLATHMARAGRALLADADILVPVPLHRLRLWRRGFNQAALLAHALRPHAPGAAVLPDALTRTRRTPFLGTLAASARAAALHGAIAVRPARRSRLAGARVLLIDDVLTTGATARACTRALLDAGAAGIDLLVCCRVPAPGRDVPTPSPAEFA